MNPSTLRDVISLRMHATVASTIRGKVRDGAARANARPFCAICRLIALWRAGGAVRHRPHADGAGSLVSDRRHPCSRGRSSPLRRGTGRRFPIRGGCPGPGDGRIEGHGVSERAAGVDSYSVVISNMDAVRTYRELVGGAIGAGACQAQARAGLFRRRPLPRIEKALRPPPAPQFRLLTRPQGGVRRDLHARRAGP